MTDTVIPSIESSSLNLLCQTTPSSPLLSSSSSSSIATTTSSSSRSSCSLLSIAEKATSTPTSSGIYDDLENMIDPTVKFEDGTIACTDFPVGQGVIALDWLSFGGWSGIQNPSDDSTGGTCRDGTYCSYACQAGMSKTQWPSTQPSDGESLGGLYCKSGYLYRTNTDTDYLCEWGVDAAYVVSELDSSVAICRTDYPGTENMVIPTYVTAGSTLPLTVVDEETYYIWQGSMTSAQYYVNNAGVSYEDGCAWGTDGNGVGNWAPLNFGAGYTNGVSYLSLIPNPNNSGDINFNVKIVAADDSSTISGTYYCENGVFSGDNTDGCTVGVTSGKAHFVLY
ncbi:hypothetical protein TPHA_0F01310 [Tetrapisispora phaffii CBS 4417]|uniref:Uncharacterized protein n=1 Tax=Tetrapisispora phaffii (strain ATCC 24235 / CBS 4417 / NBRC 1672 / NRRL Y-8282 / UCD 70-5) TaxID=1071381 RepID=G8BV34_TETPH|nr:hypothetical protein TPHA_0F01310 [Tetrapisispora phaffii CBS 4417]CCE63616.1 hypothetical protein TPHA_0F01310 [Tetrapisispora phaffii CBS 4417]